MSPATNPFRGGNVCHRLELPSRARPRRVRGARPRPVRVEAPAPPPVIVREVRPAGGPRDPQVQLLERRLAKVKALLDQREEQLQRLVGNGEVEAGLASIYREVQGLDGDSELVKRKREMMSRIFEANLELQRKLASGPHPGHPNGR